MKYTGVRILSLSVTVVIGLYLTILIANMGGYVDTIRRNQIREQVNMRVASVSLPRNMDADVRQKKIDEMIQIQEKRLGMDQPFFIRSVSFLKDAITLDLGRAQFMTSNAGSNSVRLIILERLPSTLILFAASDIILFFIALFAAWRYPEVTAVSWIKCCRADPAVFRARLVLRNISDPDFCIDPAHIALWRHGGIPRPRPLLLITSSTC